MEKDEIMGENTLSFGMFWQREDVESGKVKQKYV